MNIDELKKTFNSFICFQLDEPRQILLAKGKSNNYLIIKQLVEISKILNDKNIPHLVDENNNIQLYLE